MELFTLEHKDATNEGLDYLDVSPFKKKCNFLPGDLTNFTISLSTKLPETRARRVQPPFARQNVLKENSSYYLGGSALGSFSLRVTYESTGNFPLKPLLA